MLVQSEQRQFELLTLSLDSDIIKYREKGLYVFRFFKAGHPIFVIIDDLIPTQEMANGKPMPLFAKCANPNLFWVSLIEKAYAKMHGRYFALQGGTTDEALEDIVGVPVENCFINQQMTDVEKLKLTFETLCASHCVVGLKIDMEMFASKTADKDRSKQTTGSLGLTEAER